MTIRDALHQLLAGMGAEADPAQVLADYGFDDISSEMFSTVLAHLSDRAPMELADSLSPVVTRVSEVPFEDHEMPPMADGMQLDSPEGMYDFLAEHSLENFGSDGLYDNFDPGRMGDDMDFEASELHGLEDTADTELLPESSGLYQDAKATAAETNDAAETTDEPETPPLETRDVTPHDLEEASDSGDTDGAEDTDSTEAGWQELPNPNEAAAGASQESEPLSFGKGAQAVPATGEASPHGAEEDAVDPFAGLPPLDDIVGLGDDAYAEVDNPADLLDDQFEEFDPFEILDETDPADLDFD